MGSELRAPGRPDLRDLVHLRHVRQRVLADDAGRTHHADEQRVPRRHQRHRRSGVQQLHGRRRHRPRSATARSRSATPTPAPLPTTSTPGPAGRRPRLRSRSRSRASCWMRGARNRSAATRRAGPERRDQLPGPVVAPERVGLGGELRAPGQHDLRDLVHLRREGGRQQRAAVARGTPDAAGDDATCSADGNMYRTSGARFDNFKASDVVQPATVVGTCDADVRGRQPRRRSTT